MTDAEVLGLTCNISLADTTLDLSKGLHLGI
jgi:hypothetical protein